MGFGGFVCKNCSTMFYRVICVLVSTSVGCSIFMRFAWSTFTIKVYHESRPASDLKETMGKNSKPKIKRADWRLSFQEKTKQWTAWDSKTIAKRFHALNLWFAVLNKGFFQLAHRLITSPRRPGETKSRVWWTTWTPPPTSKTSRTFFQQLCL